jgi:hypothetical protein
MNCKYIIRCGRAAKRAYLTNAIDGNVGSSSKQLHNIVSLHKLKQHREIGQFLCIHSSLRPSGRLAKRTGKAACCMLF